MAGPLVRFVLTTFIVLVLVLMLARALRSKGVGANAQHRVRVTERYSTGRNVALLVVQAGGRSLLVGQTPGGMTTLAELDPSAATDNSTAAPADGVVADDEDAPAAAAMPPKSLVAWGRQLWAARRAKTTPDDAEAAGTDDEDGQEDDVEDELDVYLPWDGDDEVDEDVPGAEVLPQLPSGTHGPDADQVAAAAAEAGVVLAMADEVSAADVSALAARATTRATTPAPAPQQAPAPAPKAAPQVSVQSLDDADLTRVLMELDARTVLTALKGAPSSFAERVGNCFADGDEARREALVRCAVNMGSTKLDPAEVAAARREVAEVTRRLLEWGEISGAAPKDAAQGFAEVYARLGGGAR